MKQTIAITQAQRDALLDACDDQVRWADDEKEPDWRAVRRLPFVEALADDLLLPDADGRYVIRSVDRDELVTFLEHELKVVLESFLCEPEDIRRWHTSVVLLERLGRELDGDIYGGIVCHCAFCEWQQERRERMDIRIIQACSEEEADVARDDYRREAYGGEGF